jgi:RecJ-like exonuclease
MVTIEDCPACQGEGRIYKSRYGGNDPDVWDAGMCPTCEGACVVETEAEPRTLMDLEQEDFDMLEAKCR